MKSLYLIKHIQLFKKILFLMTLIIYGILFLFTNNCFAETYDLNGIMKSYIKKNFPWAEIEISDLSANSEINELPKRILFQKPPPGKTAFSVELQDGKRINATAHVKAYEWVVMSSKSMRKGDYLELTDVYLTLFDVTKIPRGAINKINDAVGKQLSRPVNANTPIVDASLQEKRVVRKGQMVFVVIESPHFIIRTTGEIKNNAYVGGKAKVMNLSSKKVISGVLVDESTVKVEF